MVKEDFSQLPTARVDKMIIGALVRISQVFRSLLWEYAKRENLSPIQIQFLLFIASHPGRYSTVTQIAREFNLTPATVSDAVKTLEQKKLIHRMPSRKDRRKNLLALTKSGQSIAHHLKHWIDPINEHLKQFTEAERKTTLKFLLNLVSSLGEAKLLQEVRTCLSCDYYDRQDSKNEENSRCVLRNVSLNSIDLRLNCPNYKSSNFN
jgi:DNA-binding MarR family transcriptional regulator